MLYIDPKDQPANVDWPPVYQLAWESRRKLRLEQAEAAAEIAKLEAFMEVYETFEGKPHGAPGPLQVTSASTVGGEHG